MKTWQGRLSHTDPSFEAFTSSVAQDCRLASYDVQISVAHAKALERARLLTDSECETVVGALRQVAAEVERGDVEWRDDLEDVHTHVEVWLREKVGELADKLHTGRSRNDQVAADLRLFVMDACRATSTAILDVQKALLELSRRYQTTVMPSYTHLQQAQPILAALPFLTYASMLSRDWDRFRQAELASDRSPLGSGAVAGAGFPLDRAYLAAEAGFSKVAAISLDAVSDRDFVIEFLSAAALCMVHLSRLAEDLILWTTAEFGFARLPDAFASGSSMMPQKKNPDAAELIRGKAALVIGDLTSGLALLKGIPLSYNRDLQEDKTPLLHAADTVLASLRVLSPLLYGLELDRDRLTGAISSFALATDLADHLVRQGLPFRQAHEIVGKLVAECVASGKTLDALDTEKLIAASPLFRQLPELTPTGSVKGKQTSGSTNPVEVEALILSLERELEARAAE